MDKKKYILICGAYSELAKGVAIGLSKLNYNLILLGKNSKKLSSLKKKIKSKTITITIDLADERLNEKIQNVCKKNKIKIYGAINFVGKHLILPVNLISYKNFEDIYKNNVFSFINLIKFFSKSEKFILNKSLIINISSVSSLRGNKSISLYSSSKAAANNLAQSYAIEMAKKGIRVNTIILGHFEKGMGKLSKKFFNNEQLLQLKAQHPLGFGKIKSLLGGIEFLLKSENDWITGINLNIDGGYSA